MSHIAIIDSRAPTGRQARAPGSGHRRWLRFAARARREAGRSGLRRAASLGGLALGSAIFSSYSTGWISEPYPALPGVSFGLVLVAGLYLWGTRQPLALFGIFAATNFAWWGAYEASLHLFSYLQDGSAQLALCGLVSGLIGSAVTTGAIAQVCTGFGTRATWSRTLVLGALAGTLLAADSTLALFVAWQGAVAASIGYGLTRRRAAA